MCNSWPMSVSCAPEPKKLSPSRYRATLFGCKKGSIQIISFWGFPHAFPIFFIDHCVTLTMNSITTQCDNWDIFRRFGTFKNVQKFKRKKRLKERKNLVRCRLNKIGSNIFDFYTIRLWGKVWVNNRNSKCPKYQPLTTVCKAKAKTAEHLPFNFLFRPTAIVNKI